MKKNEYKEKGVTDDQCEKEMLEIWGYIPYEMRVVICDDCFNRRTPEEIKNMGEEYKNVKWK